MLNYVQDVALAGGCLHSMALQLACQAETREATKVEHEYGNGCSKSVGQHAAVASRSLVVKQKALRKLTLAQLLSGRI